MNNHPNHQNHEVHTNLINISNNNNIDLLNELNNNRGITELNNKIDIFIQKRNNRKYITTVNGLDKFTNFDINRFIKIIKKKFCCSGAYNKEDNLVTFSGDQRDNIVEYLKFVGINKDVINKHGF